MRDDSLPGSIGAGAPGGSAGDTSLTDPALVRLYDALKALDKAIYETLRALDVALGREPALGPPAGLPFREMGRLKQHLEIASGAADQGPPRRQLGDIALEVHEDADPDTDEPDSED